MAKFVLIDHSLISIGGHHYDYTFQVLRASLHLGHETILACNHRFKNHASIPAGCDIFPVFRHHAYTRYTDLHGFRVLRDNHKPGRVPSLRGRFDAWLERSRMGGRERRIRSFARSCRKLFRQVRLSADDQVFFPTVSEQDLLGLARYLKCEPSTREVNWHLQFHFNIFEGREPEYAAQQDRLERVRVHFQKALDEIPEHRLHFYNTSAPLADQYNRLNVAPFEALAYPVNDAFCQPVAPAPQSPPLRVICGGAVRGEKGSQHLSDLTRRLWDDQLSNGQMQLSIQSKLRRFSKKPRLQIKLPEKQDRRADEHQSPKQVHPIVYVPHPLDSQSYVNFIRGADVGLMMYDQRRYYSRRAGVLGELLTAGVPVVVPAGCWLAEQIAEPNFRHVESVRSILPCVGCHTTAQLYFGDHSSAAMIEADVPEQSDELAVRFSWLQPSAGTYARIELKQLDKLGTEINRFAQIVGRRESGQPVELLFHLYQKTASVKLVWRNAYDRATTSVADIDLSFHDAGQLAQRRTPLGSVGLAAADRSCIPELLRDIQRHYVHYRSAACEFSKPWFEQHDPQRTIGQLVENSKRAKVAWQQRNAA